MRRAITLIMVLGIVIAGAAAEDIDVTYTVRNEDLEQIKVAFTTEAVSDVTDAKAATNHENDITLTVAEGATEATYGTGSDGLYIVWYAYTAKNVNVSVGISTLGDKATNYLPWSVTVSNSYQTSSGTGALSASQTSPGTNDDTISDDVIIETAEGTPSTAPSSQQIVSVTGNATNMKQTWGNKSISVSADLIGAAEATYTGTITATISAT